MEMLSGNRAAAPRLMDLTLSLAARVLALTGEDEAAARSKVNKVIASGAAMERFAQMVAALGGPPDMAEDWRTHLPAAKIVGDVTAPTAGHIAAIDGEALGLAVVALGGGRRVETDQINPSVGFSDMKGVGDRLDAGDPICTIHAADEDAAQAAALAVRAAVTIGDAPKETPLVIERFDP